MPAWVGGEPLGRGGGCAGLGSVLLAQGGRRLLSSWCFMLDVESMRECAIEVERCEHEAW